MDHEDLLAKIALVAEAGCAVDSLEAARGGFDIITALIRYRELDVVPSTDPRLEDLSINPAEWESYDQLDR
jgi:hypothetical protein